MGLSVEASSDFFVCLNEAFQLFLEAVVLVVEVGHVFIEGVNFSLQFDLVGGHLASVLLQPVNFVCKTSFVLLQFLLVLRELVNFEVAVLAKNIFVFVSFEELLLGIGVLLVLTFSVPQFCVELVKDVFVFLDGVVGLTDFGNCPCYHLFFVVDQRLDAFSSLAVVLLLSVQDLESFGLLMQLLFKVDVHISQAQQCLVVVSGYILLFVNHAFVVFNFLAQVQVILVLNAGLLSETLKILLDYIIIILRLSDLVEQSDLLVFLVDILLFGQIKFPDESVSFLSVSPYLLKVLLFHMLRFDLGPFELVEKISVLVFQLSHVLLSSSQLLNFGLQFSNKKLLVLTYAVILCGHGLLNRSDRQSGSVGSFPGLVHDLVVRSQRTSMLVASIMV